MGDFDSGGEKFDLLNILVAFGAPLTIMVHHENESDLCDAAAGCVGED